MRTTICIDEAMHSEAKLLAARAGKSLSSVIEDALREALARQHRTGPREPVHLIPVSGLHPGADLDN